MRSSGINGEGELRGQLANPGSPGKMAVRTECVCVGTCVTAITYTAPLPSNVYEVSRI